MPLHRFLLPFLLLGSLAGQVPGKPDSDTIRQEAARRRQALIQEGYNLTYGWSLGSQGEKKGIQLPVLVPETDTEHLFSIWFETLGGEASVRLVTEDGKVLIAWTGRKGEAVISRRVPTGKYVFEIDASNARGGRAELGIKGALAQQCDLNPSLVREVPAAPSKGFHWPYLLHVPQTVKNSTLLVLPNNTTFAVENLDLIRASAACDLQRASALADRLGCPVLVPLFPRPASSLEGGNLYLHALSRDSLLSAVEPWKRVDLQLLAMIRSAQAGLAASGIKVASKVFLSGFSASGSFVNRFTLLHPEAVSAVACGSPGGWPTVPVALFNGDRLDYPVGIADLKVLTGSPLNDGALKQVRWFFFLGDQDQNDAVPHRDSFTKANEDLIHHRFGKTLPERWKEAERVFSHAGIQARFALYPGVPHIVTPEIQADIARFFEECLAASVDVQGATAGRAPSNGQ